MKSVLITGGTGTLGNGLVDRLLREGQLSRICILSRGEKEQAAMARKFADARLRFFIGDVRDYIRLRRAMDGCEVVIHGAALKRIEVGVYNPDEMVKTNVLGTANVIEAARDVGTNRCILISSDKAFEPVSPYGYTKALAESLFNAAHASSSRPAGPMFAGVRYGNVWCSNGSVVPLWRSILSSGGRPSITNPDCTRFFMLLSEAVDFVLGAIEKMQGGEMFIPDLPAYKLGDLACAMMTGRLEFPPDVIGLPAHEKLHESMEAGKCSKDARRMSISELRGHL